MGRNTSYIKADGTWNNQQTLIINNPIYNDSAKKREMRRTLERKVKAKTITQAAFMMWLELSDNIDGFEWKLSPAFFKNECGIDDNAYLEAKKRLEAEGYIVWTTRNSKGNGILGYFNVCGKYVPDVAGKKEKKPVGKETSSVDSAANVNYEVEYERLRKSKQLRVWTGPTGDVWNYTFQNVLDRKFDSIMREADSMYFEKEAERTSWKKRTIVDYWYSLPEC